MKPSQNDAAPGTHLQPSHPRQHAPLQVSVAKVWHQLEHLPSEGRAQKRSSLCGSAYVLYGNSSFHHGTGEPSMEQRGFAYRIGMGQRPGRTLTEAKGQERQASGLEDHRTTASDRQGPHAHCHLPGERADPCILGRNVRMYPIGRLLPHPSVLSDTVKQYATFPEKSYQPTSTTCISKLQSSGGLQISMDLTTAFDLVSWATIREA